MGNTNSRGMFHTSDESKPLVPGVQVQAPDDYEPLRDEEGSSRRKRTRRRNQQSRSMRGESARSGGGGSGAGGGGGSSSALESGRGQSGGRTQSNISGYLSAAAAGFTSGWSSSSASSRSTDDDMIPSRLPKIALSRNDAINPELEPMESSDDEGSVDLLSLNSTPIMVYYYSADRVESKRVFNVQLFLAEEPPEWASVTWIKVEALNEDCMKLFADKFDLHPLAIEDSLTKPQRPKIDGYEHFVFIVSRWLRMQEGQELRDEQVSIYLLESTVITFQESQSECWHPITHRVDREKSRLRSNDASYLVYALVDYLVDIAFPILEVYGDKLEDLEVEIMDTAKMSLMKEVHAVKRELLLLRRVMWPMREVMSSMQQQHFQLITQNTHTYIRDTYDHCVQIIDIIETYREIGTGLLELYSTTVSHHMDKIMKVLTIVNTIFIPLTWMCGIWGMNFTGDAKMPMLTWRYGYISFWIITGAVTLVQIWVFRWMGWW